MNVEAKTEYIPGDPILIRDIISQLKSQGVFDQFRKECISDVDTKPAYQNLCHRVDGQVSSYLSDIRWGPDLNKNQLREKIRKFVDKCTFVEPGISRIVDQLVNPRINTVLVPKVEDIVYQYVGIPPVDRNVPNESSHDSIGNHKFDSHDSSFEKSWSSSSSYKKFDNYSKMDSSSSLPSLFDLKVEPPDEMKEKNEDSRIDLFHSEGGDDDNSRAYSTIDSDEDNLNDDVEEPSPSFEAFDLPDACNSASVDSDFPAEVANSLDDCPPGMDVDEKSRSSNVEPNENTNTDSLDDRSSQIDSKVLEETAPSLFEVPKTPTINYETSEDSDDNGLKLSDAPEEVPTNQEHGSLADDIPDFSNVDKIAKQIAEDNRDQEKIVSADDEVVLRNGDCDRQKVVVEVIPKLKEDKTEKHHKDGEKESKAADSGAKDSKHRDRKYSEHRKDKHKSDKRDSSRDDRERKHREKERSNHDSSRSKSSKSRTESCDKTRKSSDEKEPAEDEAASKSKSKDDHKSHRSHDARKSRDEKKQKSSSSGERRSKDDRSKEKRSRSDDGKEDRKKSRHDRDRSKDIKKSSQDEEKKLKKTESTDTKDAEKNSQEEEKMKMKKPESVESKKSGKSQCGTDDKKVRTDRRSSDRDSNGPSSSSNHSHHRSSSKSDKEKHSEKSRHSSSLSSTSHKSKKSDNSKSVSSDRHSEDGCENSVSIHRKEHAHHEKKKDEKVSSRSMGRDEESKDSSAVSLDSKGQKEQSHEKKKDDTVSSRAISDPKEPSAASDFDSKKQEAKFSKISAHPGPPKRSLVEMNSKEVTGISTELSGDGQNAPLKTSENNFSAFNIKKPKIARNEFEFGKVVRLRKEYKEKMRLLQQQGKENNSKSCQDSEENQIIEQLPPVPLPKELKVTSNGSKNGLIKDLKLSITRVDACYKIVDGSCLVNEAGSRASDLSAMETPAALPESDTKTTKMLKLNIKPVVDEKQDKLIKLKICRSISPTSGKERTKCVQSSTCVEDTKLNSTVMHEVTKLSTFCVKEDTKSSPCEEIRQHPLADNRETATIPVLAAENQVETVFLSENEDDLEEDAANDEDLLCHMNIEEIIGCRTDCTRISYDSGLNGEKNPEVIEPVKDHDADKNVVLFDEDNKENVGTESQCVNDVTTNRVPKKCSPEVHYFEPSSPTSDFTKFVENLIRETEDVSLLNFTIQLDYPKEYDAIFRSQLGASVSRVVKPSASGVDSASTVSSVAETLPAVREEQSDTPTNELGPANEFNSILNRESTCDSSHDDQLVAPAHKVKIVNSTKRKTLGIKRRISSVGGSTVCKTPSSDVTTESMVGSRVGHPASVAENNAKKKSPILSASLAVETSSCLNTFTHDLSRLPEITLPRIPAAAEEDEKKRKLDMYSSFNNNVPESRSYPIPAKTPKKLRKNSPVRSSDEILTEIVPKRTPYKNKCYYDSSDLYKPRPSFLASSRRSRALNPDSK